MPRFKLTCTRTELITFEVDADNASEAIDAGEYIFEFDTLDNQPHVRWSDEDVDIIAQQID